MKIKDFLEGVVEGKICLEDQVSFLSAYTPDLVGVNDLMEFYKFMTERMVRVEGFEEAMDVCGTGGSGLNRINTSTLVALRLSEMGVKVAKHGNKSASGRFGSFDLIEGLGLDYEYNDCLRFIYARDHHPVMRFFAEARRVFGKPTVFNLLGPLLNPAGVKRQLIGVSFKGCMRMMAEFLRLIGSERVVLVRGEDGLDEVSLSGRTEVVELKYGKIFEYVLEPEDFGLKMCEAEALDGGDENFKIKTAKRIMQGDFGGVNGDLVAINGAMALYVAGRCDDLKIGVKMMKGGILGRIAAFKAVRCSERDFKAALDGEGVGLIAEIKRCSPSGGVLREDFDVAKIAEEYEQAGVSCISVLTDEDFFGGGFENLTMARRATLTTPLLCKDFIVREDQIVKAREYGADAILLIAALLDEKKMMRFIDLAKDFKMDCLCEVHDEEELKMVLACGADIVGVNNRDLRSFEIDLDVSVRLSGLMPEDVTMVSESGIMSKNDVAALGSRVDAVLIGSCLMECDDLTKKVYEFLQK